MRIEPLLPSSEVAGWAVERAPQLIEAIMWRDPAPRMVLLEKSPVPEGPPVSRAAGPFPMRSVER